MYTCPPKKKTKNSIQELKYDVINVLSINQKRTNKPLILCFVEIKCNENNKEIYNVRKLMNLVVTFNAPHIK